MRTRVLHVLTRLNVGGPALYTTLLTDGLDADRYDVLLASGRGDRTEGNHLELHGRHSARVREIPTMARAIRPWDDLQAYRSLVALIRRFRPHVVHTHTAKAGLLGRLAARRCNVPAVVHTFHGHVFHGYFSRAKTAIFIRLERTLARRTDRLIAVSQVVRDEVLAHGIGRADQFEVIRLGLDLGPFVAASRYAGQLRRGLGIDQDRRLVGIVARLAPIKAHEVFLDVAAAVAAVEPDVLFLIVGDGECRASLEGMVRDRGLTGRVQFLGWRADLDCVYADLDVVMLTSRNEGSPVALIEAMAAGRPVVGTRVGGVPELVGDAGLLADAGDVDGLGRAVLRLLRDPGFAADLGRRGQARVATDYGRGRFLRDIDGLYSRLLASSRAAGLP